MTMRKRGRPVLGAITGFLFGISVSLALLVFGVLNLGNVIIGILPLAFLVLGIVWALLAPLGQQTSPTAAVET
jgi:hypothetical protein